MMCPSWKPVPDGQKNCSVGQRSALWQICAETAGTGNPPTRRGTEASRDEAHTAAPALQPAALRYRYGTSLTRTRNAECNNGALGTHRSIDSASTTTTEGLQSKPSEEILWELVPESKAAIGQPIKSTNPQSEVVWSLVPDIPQPETTHPANAGGSASTQQLEWELIPGSVNPLGPKTSSTLATKESAGSDEPPADAVAFENSQPARRIPAPPPPPALQALNRSIAFGDGSAGPDIGWSVPNGFRWSRRWFADLNVYEPSPTRRRQRRRLGRWRWCGHPAHQPATDRPLECGPQHVLSQLAKQPKHPRKNHRNRRWIIQWIPHCPLHWRHGRDCLGRRTADPMG